MWKACRMSFLEVECRSLINKKLQIRNHLHTPPHPTHNPWPSKMLGIWGWAFHVMGWTFLQLHYYPHFVPFQILTAGPITFPFNLKAISNDWGSSFHGLGWPSRWHGRDENISRLWAFCRAFMCNPHRWGQHNNLGHGAHLAIDRHRLCWDRWRTWNGLFIPCTN